MAYNAWVTGAGRAAFEFFRVEARLRLVQEVLFRIGVHETEQKELYIDVADLSSARLFDLLGEFWTFYGWRERRHLARSQDFDLALAKTILQSVGHELAPLDSAGRRLQLDADVYHHSLKQYDERRVAMKRNTKEAHRSRSLGVKMESCLWH